MINANFPDIIEKNGSVKIIPTHGLVCYIRYVFLKYKKEKTEVKT